MRALSSRRRATAVSSVAALAVTTLLTVGAGINGSPAAADPADDCTEAYPIDALEAEDPVTGLTVSRGTEPDEFGGEIIGVLGDGIAPGVDMILAELSSPAIDRYGVWSGMSGSPVYAEDGRLIGAVAWGLSWGASPIAGITPFAKMDDYLGDAEPLRRVSVDDRTARAIAAASDVTARQAAEGMRSLPMPLSISGVSQKRLEKFSAGTKKHPYVGNSVAAGGIGGRVAEAATVDTIVPGGNLAAAVAYGDVKAAGTGTATSVCEGEVVGFGHPFFFSGATSLSMHPASALLVQEDSVFAAFKVVNVGEPVGTITDDRLTGITGPFGPIPETTDITSDVSFEDRSRTGTTAVNLPQENAWMTLIQQLLNHDVVVDGHMGGGEVQSWTVTGTDADGTPFTLSSGDRYVSQFDITFTAIWDVADVVYGISRLPGVTIDTVVIDSDVDDNTNVLRMVSLEQRRGGEWVELGRKSPAMTAAGKQLVLRAGLESSAGDLSSTVIKIAVPKKAAGSRGYLSVRGGSRDYSNAAYRNSLEKIIKGVTERARNDEVVAEFYAYGGRRKNVRLKEVSETQDLVVRGSESARVRIR